jgi:hypothetical protein
MMARATAPSGIGPGSVFPDAGKWDFSGFERLVCQLSNLSLLLIVVSFLGIAMVVPLADNINAIMMWCL